MRKHQGGVTMIGWLLILIPVGIVVYAGIRLTPIYLNYYRVVKSLNQLASEGNAADGAQPNAPRAAGGFFARWRLMPPRMAVAICCW